LSENIHQFLSLSPEIAEHHDRSFRWQTKSSGIPDVVL
jgi:hypothetical protein